MQRTLFLSFFLLITAGLIFPEELPVDQTAALSAALRADNPAAVTVLLQAGLPVNEKLADGSYPLHLAAAAGAVAAAERLLAAGAELTTRDLAGRTALHLAATGGFYELVRLLVQQGLEINLYDDQGRSALLTAAQNGHKRITEYLIGQGADIMHQYENGGSLLAAATARGWFFLVRKLIARGILIHEQAYHGSALKAAVENSHYFIAWLLLREFPALLNDQPGEVDLLNTACLQGSYNLAELLLATGAAVNGINTRTAVPLFTALHHPDAELARELSLLFLRHEADLSLSDPAPDGWGRTPLHLAAAYGWPEVCIRMLEQGAEIDARDAEGNSPLILAVSNGHYPAAAGLVEAGAELNLYPARGKTALGHAIANHDFRLIRLLVEGGAELYHLQQREQTDPVLNELIRQQQWPAAGWLIEQGVELNKQDAGGRTALHYACCFGNTEFVRLLLEKGADNTLVDNNQSNGFLTAVLAGQQDLIRLFHSLGYDLNSRDSKGRTALHYTLRNWDLELTSLLVHLGADLNLTDNQGNTPLLHALLSSDAQNFTADREKHVVSCILYLLRQQADLKLANHKGENVFTLAAANPLPTWAAAILQALTNPAETLFTHIDMPQLIPLCLAEGAAINQRDQNGNTPIMLAAAGNYTESVKVLLAYSPVLSLRNNRGETAARLTTDNEVLAVMEQANNVRYLMALALENNLQDLAAALLTTETGFEPTNPADWQLVADNFRQGKREQAEFFISQLKRLDYPDDAGNTLLMYAALHGWDDLVPGLLAGGINPDSSNPTGKTAFCFAAEAGNLVFLQTLLNFGADPLVNDQTLLALLQLALKINSLNFAKLLLSRLNYPQLAADRQAEYAQLLPTVLAEGNLEALKLLTASGCLAAATADGLAAFMQQSITTSWDEAVSYFLRSGQAIETRDSAGNTPLLLAARNGAGKIFEQLAAAGASLQAVNNQGETALHLAASQGRLFITESLLAAGANVHARTTSGETPLLLAAAGGHLSITRLLIQAGSHINQVNAAGQTAVVRLAAAPPPAGRASQILELLLPANSYLDAVDMTGRTALLYAISNAQTQLSRFLIELGVNGVNIDKTDKNRQTPLMYAVRSGNRELAVLLVDNQAALNAIDRTGRTVLDYALTLEEPSLAAYLAANGARKAVAIVQ